MTPDSVCGCPHRFGVCGRKASMLEAAAGCGHQFCFDCLQWSHDDPCKICKPVQAGGPR